MAVWFQKRQSRACSLYTLGTINFHHLLKQLWVFLFEVFSGVFTQIEQIVPLT